MQISYSKCGTTLQPPGSLLPVRNGKQLESMLAHSMRMYQRYVGHCNLRTDIKEASYLGQEDQVVACGSDHGQVLLFDAETGELLRILWADMEVANCVQCHPSLPVVATSGLEDVVRIVTPSVSLIARGGKRWDGIGSSCLTQPAGLFIDSVFPGLLPLRCTEPVCALCKVHMHQLWLFRLFAVLVVLCCWLRFAVCC
jgi:WD40 repeat protein